MKRGNTEYIANIEFLNTHFLRLNEREIEGQRKRPENIVSVKC